MRKTGARRRNNGLVVARWTSKGSENTTEAQEQTMHHHVHAAGAERSPLGRFKRPMDVVEAAGIPVIEMLTILKAWEVDERALQRAEDEGWVAANTRICIGSRRRSCGCKACAAHL